MARPLGLDGAESKERGAVQRTETAPGMGHLYEGFLRLLSEAWVIPNGMWPYRSPAVIPGVFVNCRTPERR